MKLKLINILAKSLLNEYNEKLVQQLISKFKKENRDITDDDIRKALTRFDQIKANIPSRINSAENIKKGITNIIVMPKKFTEEDPKTGKKPLNPSDILNYTWKDLEYLLDSYGSKETKVSSKDFYTVQEADLVKISGVPLVYNTSELKIYEGSEYENCIKLNYAFKYKDKNNRIYSYEFCIGRKEEASNRYYPYRFGSGGKGALYRSFYFVVDPTQSADMEGNTSNRENFINWYHFFIIHCFENGKFGVTDAVNLYGIEHELAKDKQEGSGVEWNEIGNFMIKYGGESGKKSWNKIKNLKNIFKYVPPSEKETDIALVRDQVLNFNTFQKLTRNQKALYIGRRADDPAAFTQQMFRSLDTELKQLALRSNNGYKPTYDDLKNSPALLKSYAKFRFTRGLVKYKEGNTREIVLPLPFVQYLDDNQKREYIKIFKDKLKATTVEKYFGEQYAKEYVQDQLQKLEFIEPGMQKYIDNPKLKQFYDMYSKVYDSWKFESLDTSKEDNFETVPSAENENADPAPVFINQWRKLSDQEKNTIIELTLKFDKDLKYELFLVAVPYIIKDGNKIYVLLAKDKKDKEEQKWALVDAFSGKIIKDNINEASSIGDNYLFTGNQPSANFQKVYNINDLKID